MKIAIVTVGYNRVDSLSRLLASLNNANYSNDEVTLVISVDKSNTNIVEEFADSFLWKYGKKIVDKHNENLGLREHMLSLTKWFEYFDALVVLEDDVFVSPNFYSYVKQTTKQYYNDDKIAGISLYSYSLNYHTSELFVPYKKEHDVYFMNCAMSWGQVWMKNQWLAFVDWYKTHIDFPDLIHLPKTICNWPKSSWLKYHTRYCIEQNKFFVYPYIGYSTNCGALGTHNRKGDSSYQIPLQMGNIKELNLPKLGEDSVCYDGFFENIALYSILGLPSNTCCIDLNGAKNNRENKRYWLTTNCLNFKVLKSYGLDFKPIEQNVMMNHRGESIFLYDTNVVEKHVKSKKYQNKLIYCYNMSNAIPFLRKYGIKNLIKDFIEKIRDRF